MASITINNNQSGLSATSLINDASLVAYWKLEDLNSTVGSYPLTNAGGLTFGSGQFGNAVLGNGSVSLTRTNDIPISASGPVTFSFWARMNSLTLSEGGLGVQFMGLSIASSSNLFRCGRYQSGGIQYIFFNRTNYGSGTPNVFYTETMDLVNFYHIVFTYDGTNISGYVNGTATSSAATSGSGSGGSDTFYICGDPYGNANADVDDFAIFDKVLTQSEVNEIYNKGISPLVTSISNITSITF